MAKLRVKKSKKGYEYVQNKNKRFKLPKDYDLGDLEVFFKKLIKDKPKKPRKPRTTAKSQLNAKFKQTSLEQSYNTLVQRIGDRETQIQKLIAQINEKPTVDRKELDDLKKKLQDFESTEFAEAHIYNRLNYIHNNYPKLQSYIAPDQRAQYNELLLEVKQDPKLGKLVGVITKELDKPDIGTVLNASFPKMKEVFTTLSRGAAIPKKKADMQQALAKLLDEEGLIEQDVGTSTFDFQDKTIEEQQEAIAKIRQEILDSDDMKEIARLRKRLKEREELLRGDKMYVEPLPRHNLQLYNTDPKYRQLVDDLYKERDLEEAQKIRRRLDLMEQEAVGPEESEHKTDTTEEPDGKVERSEAVWSEVPDLSSIVGNGLPDGLYGSQVEVMGASIDPDFRGICFGDKLADAMIPHIKEPWSSVIINTITLEEYENAKKGNGEMPNGHYLCCILDNDNEQIILYDPLAMATPGNILTQITKILEKTPFLYQFKTNSVRNEHWEAETCGFHCLLFLERMVNGDGFIKSSYFDKVDSSEQGEADVKKFKLVAEQEFPDI